MRGNLLEPELPPAFSEVGRQRHSSTAQRRQLTGPVPDCGPEIPGEGSGAVPDQNSMAMSRVSAGRPARSRR